MWLATKAPLILGCWRGGGPKIFPWGYQPLRDANGWGSWTDRGQYPSQLHSSLPWKVREFWRRHSAGTAGDIYRLGQILRPAGCCSDLSLSNPGSANFSQAVNSLGLRGHMSSVARMHLCCCSRKTPSITHKWVWLCSIKTWFTKKVVCGPRKTSRFNLVQEDEATRYQPSQSLQIQSKPPYPQFAFHGFSYVWSAVVWKQTNLLLTYHQKVNSSPDTLPTSFAVISSHGHFITSHRHKKGEYGTWDTLREWERSNSYIFYHRILF